jgi:hypothetical protein
VTGNFYKENVLKKLKRCFKRRPHTGFKKLSLLHDKVLADRSAIVADLEQGKGSSSST